MRALQFIIPIYILLFIFYGIRDIKGFLLLTGIVTLPFRTTYSFIETGPYIGWTGGILISLSDISFIILFVYLLVKKRGLLNASSNVIYPTVCFVVACSLSMINSTWLKMTFYQIIMITTVYFLYYYVLVNSIESERDLRQVVSFFIISLLLQSSIAGAQYLTGEKLDFFSTGMGFGGFETIVDEADIYRVVGTVGKPNGFAMYIVPLLLLCISITWGGKVYKKAGFIAVVLGSLVLLLSFSRGGWLSFIVSLLFLFCFMFRRRIIRLGTVFIIILVLLFIITIFFADIQKRIYGDDKNAAASRIPLMKIAFNMIKAHPIIGVGTNTYRSVIHSYTTAPDLQDVYLDVVHNQYLYVFAESGLVGLISFLWLMVSFFGESLKCAQNKENRFVQAIGIGITAGLFGASIHMMVDMYSSPLNMGLLFLLTGLCTAARRVGQKESGPRVVRAAGVVSKNYSTLVIEDNSGK